MPSYLTKPPQNPFELSKNEASRLGYPRNVRYLNLPEKQVQGRYAPPSRHCEIWRDFFDDLVCSTKPIHIILRNYDRPRVNSLKWDIIFYFSYLQKRLPQQDLDYDTMVENYGNCYRINYVICGTRFWNWLTESKLFNNDTLRSYSVLLYVYLSKFPWRILKLHEKLRKANLGLATYQPKKGHFDYKMVSFKLLDLWPLHNSLKKIGSLAEQQKYFNSSVYRSNIPWKDFLIQELKKCLNYYEIEFLVLDMGILCNDASLIDHTFQYALAFKDDHVNTADFPTMFLTFKAIQNYFYQNYEIKVNECVDFDGLSIVFDFGNLSGNLESFECNITHETRFVSTWSLIRFLSKCDNRFLDMTLVLNYWATSLGFYDNFYCYSFVLMIVFALQQTNPPVFKPLDELICDTFGSEFPLDHKFVEDKNWIETSENKQTTGELIVHFFRYYHQFQFEDCVISPRDGKTSDKSDYLDSGDNFFSSWISVEYPFDQDVEELVVCRKKNMNQFRNCLSTYLTDLKLCSTNYLQVLTNPAYFNLPSDIYKRNRKFNSATLNSPTVSTSQLHFETKSNLVSIDKIIDSTVHVKEAQLIDLSPLSMVSDLKPQTVECTVTSNFTSTEIDQVSNSTETQVKPTSPVLSRDEINESVHDCDKEDDDGQCRCKPI